VVLGKFVGLLGAVTLTILLMALIYLCVVGYETGSFDAFSLIAVAFQIIEMAFFIALLICLSALTAPLTATICAILVLFTGHLIGNALENARRIGGVTYRSVQGAYYILPNLDKFNVRELVVHRIGVPWDVVLLTILYAAVYIAVLLSVATIALRRREL
jgi:ABC-type transport system involved in multi-copper enzyme maturation permease subunit